MSYLLLKTVSFGASRVGLTGVGYRLYDSTGQSVGPRVDTGILEIGDGQYCALVQFPDDFVGFIRWDTGEVIPAAASEEINPQTAENMDIKVSTRSSHTPAQVRAEMDASSTRLAHLDADTSTRLAASAYTAPDNPTINAIASYVDTEVAAIKAKTDNLPSQPAATGDAMTLTTGERTSIAAVVWDRLTSALTVAGSIGKYLLDTLAAIKSKSDLISTTVQIVSPVSKIGNEITLYRDSAVTVPLSALGDISGRTYLYFTVKHNLRDADDKSYLQVREGYGLTYLGAAEVGAGARAGASLTVTNAALGDIDVSIKDTAAASLPLGDFYWDVKEIIPGGLSRPLAAGKLTVLPTATRAVT